MKEIKIHIEGMKCEGCVNRVKNVIGSLKDKLLNLIIIYS